MSSFFDNLVLFPMIYILKDNAETKYTQIVYEITDVSRLFWQYFPLRGGGWWPETLILSYWQRICVFELIYRQNHDLIASIWKTLKKLYKTYKDATNILSVNINAQSNIVYNGNS